MVLSKKGDLSIRYVVLFSLGMIVLIVIALIFYFGVDDMIGRLKNIYSGIPKEPAADLFKK